MEGGRGHKSHPLEFPLYSGFSRYVKVCRYIYIYIHIGVDRARYTNSSPFTPSRYRFTIVRATLPNFGVTMGLCLAGAGSPGSSSVEEEIRPSRLRHENEGEGEETKRNEEREREREVDHEGRGISLRVTTLFALARNQRNSHEARYGPTFPRGGTRSAGPFFVEIRG